MPESVGDERPDSAEKSKSASVEDVAAQVRAILQAKLAGIGGTAAEPSAKDAKNAKTEASAKKKKGKNAAKGNASDKPGKKKVAHKSGAKKGDGDQEKKPMKAKKKAKVSKSKLDQTKRTPEKGEKKDTSSNKVKAEQSKMASSTKAKRVTSRESSYDASFSRDESEDSYSISDTRSAGRGKARRRSRSGSGGRRKGGHRRSRSRSRGGRSRGHGKRRRSVSASPRRHGRRQSSHGRSRSHSGRRMRSRSRRVGDSRGRGNSGRWGGLSHGSGYAGRESDRVREQERNRDRERDRQRGRERDREFERERARDRDRERERGRQRDWDNGKSRESSAHPANAKASEKRSQESAGGKHGVQTDSGGKDKPAENTVAQTNAKNGAGSENTDQKVIEIPDAETILDDGKTIDLDPCPPVVASSTVDDVGGAPPAPAAKAMPERKPVVKCAAANDENDFGDAIEDAFGVKSQEKTPKTVETVDIDPQKEEKKKVEKQKKVEKEKEKDKEDTRENLPTTKKKAKEFAWMDSDDEDEEEGKDVKECQEESKEDKDGKESKEGNETPAEEEEDSIEPTVELLDQVQNFGRMMLVATSLRKRLQNNTLGGAEVAAACRSMGRTKFFDRDVLDDLHVVIGNLLQAERLDATQTDDAIQCFRMLNAYDRDVFSTIARAFKTKTHEMTAALRSSWLEIFKAFGHNADLDFLQFLEVPGLLVTQPGYKRIRCWHFSRGTCRLEAQCTFSHDPSAPLSLADGGNEDWWRSKPLVMTQNQKTLGRGVYGLSNHPDMRAAVAAGQVQPNMFAPFLVPGTAPLVPGMSIAPPVPPVVPPVPPPAMPPPLGPSL